MSQSCFQTQRYLNFSPNNLDLWLEARKYSFLLKVLVCDTVSSFSVIVHTSWQFTLEVGCIQLQRNATRCQFNLQANTTARWFSETWCFWDVSCRRLIGKYNAGTDRTSVLGFCKHFTFVSLETFFPLAALSLAGPKHYICVHSCPWRSSLTENGKQADRP